MTLRILNRRAFSRLALGASLAALAAGCSRPTPGPKAITLGRDVCEHCNMIISELRYAAQIWDARRTRARLFDDVGCAVSFAAVAGEIDDPGLLFWVADAGKPGAWLEARTASYKDGFQTPMGHGYAAAPAGQWPTSYADMLAAVRKKALCEPASAT
ncbi:MAG: hypothetical protein IPL88_02190 [Rhizobiales bacterium]|nr:hypothetical protein [Hyphomicrobiales bacterium]